MPYIPSCQIVDTSPIEDAPIFDSSKTTVTPIFILHHYDESTQTETGEDISARILDRLLSMHIEGGQWGMNPTPAEIDIKLDNSDGSLIDPLTGDTFLVRDSVLSVGFSYNDGTNTGTWAYGIFWVVDSDTSGQDEITVILQDARALMQSATGTWTIDTDTPIIPQFFTLLESIGVSGITKGSAVAYTNTGQVEVEGSLLELAVYVLGAACISWTNTYIYIDNRGRFVFDNSTADSKSFLKRNQYTYTSVYSKAQYNRIGIEFSTNTSIIRVFDSPGSQYFLLSNPFFKKLASSSEILDSLDTYLETLTNRLFYRFSAIPIYPLNTAYGLCSSRMLDYRIRGVYYSISYDYDGGLVGEYTIMQSYYPVNPKMTWQNYNNVKKWGELIYFSWDEMEEN